MPKLMKVPGYDWLGLHPKTGRYYVKIYIASLRKQLPRTTGQTDLRKAVRVGKQILAEAAKIDPDYVPRNYGEIVMECFEVEEKNRNWRERTRVEAHLIRDNYLIPAFGELDINDVTDTRWLRQVDRWRETTKRTRFAHVRVYAVMVDRYAFRKGYKRFQCSFPVQDPPKRPGLALNPKQLEAIMGEVKSPHVRLFLTMGVTMGMRHSEMTRLTWDRVDFKGRRIILRPEDVKTGSKTGRGREIAIAPEVLPLLRERFKDAKSRWVFPNRTNTGPLERLRSPIRRLRRKVGYHFTPHDLRHTFYTRKLLHERKDPLKVSEYGGTALRTLQGTYIHATAEDTADVVANAEE